MHLETLRDITPDMVYSFQETPAIEGRFGYVSRRVFMPIYKFHCEKCEKEYEDLVSKRGDTSPCPDCGCDKVHRMVTAPAGMIGKDGATSSSTGSSCSCSTCNPSKCK